MYKVLCLGVLLGLVINFKLDDDHYDPVPIKERKIDYTIHPILASRTSQTEMTGAAISDSDLMAIFEAARWAPSAYNIQPWRFIYAKHGTARFTDFLTTLESYNQVWAKNASVIIYQIGANWQMEKGDVQQVTYNTFDSGSSFMSLSLEANGRGYVSHAMAGLNYDKAYKTLGVTKTSHTIHLAIALGVPPVTRAAPETIGTITISCAFISHFNVLGNDISTLLKYWPIASTVSGAGLLLVLGGTGSWLVVATVADVCVDLTCLVKLDKCLYQIV
ncbi:unnamed protein product [Medioppia subpectinata]|uniref:Nitroreductase domain-containing protein n=1 Tax=Medioppia subpectinata TaxID=1979941 RepID=A0A7R9LI75_9ACAR|nr:unnamed protein product [Medioppia subpectinata]CAG2119084.1 unnamed protein product [Medioppia subpectinata]